MKNQYLLVLSFMAVIMATAFSQSLLTTAPETSEQVAARQVLLAPAQTRDAILGQLNDAFSRLWDHPNPQGVLDEIGTKGAALFAINAQFATVLQTLLTQEGDVESLAKFQAIMAKIPPHTINQDGTVTINAPQPAPTPEPLPTPEAP